MSQTLFHTGVVLLVLVVALTGCAVQDLPQATVSPLATAGKPTSPNSPVTTPVQPHIDRNVKPAPGKAAVHGILKIQPGYLLGELFLAKAVPTSDPNISLLELDDKVAPKATIDRATGEFIILNVEPGKYGLIAWEPMNATPLNDPKTGQTLYLTLVADKVTDAGSFSVP